MKIMKLYKIVEVFIKISNIRMITKIIIINRKKIYNLKNLKITK